MRLVVTTNGQHRDVLVEVDQPRATVADLCRAVGLGSDAEVGAQVGTQVGTPADPGAASTARRETLPAPGRQGSDGPGNDVPPGIDVDGRFVPAATLLADAGLHDGAVIAPAAPHGPAWHREAMAAWITVVAGAGTGDRV
ncbi:MAG TPA: hypothetical protein VJ978_00680, partial [Nitriliruptoraceae bacterium]|nr:hypothetical protein [Nitriliruptoraceae bacterium]